MKPEQVKSLVVAGALIAASASALASGGDTTFGTGTTGAVGTLANWLTGSMGQLFAVGALAVGLGVGIVKQNLMSIAVGTGIALAATAGPSVLNGIFGAAL